MNDINLLPEELRGDEQRLSNQPPGPQPAAAWHWPASGNNQASAHQPPTPAGGPAKVLSVEPPPSKPDIKPQVPIFDLAAAAKNSPVPKQWQPKADRPLAGPTQEKRQSQNGSATKPVVSTKEKPGRSSGLFSKFFGKKDPQNRIVENKKDLPGQPGAHKIIDVNLIPEGSDLLPSRHFYPYFFYAALGGLVAVGLLFLGLVLYQQKVASQELELTAKVNESEMVYNQLQARAAALSVWSKKVTAIQSLFDNHVYWTKFFEALQSVTTPDVYYSDINTAVDGSVTLSAGAGSYVAVAKQYLAYQQAASLIKEVRLSDIAGDPASGEITFSVKLQFWPEVFFLTLNNN